MPVYFIESSRVDRDRVEIAGALAHHLRDVLRLRPGEPLVLVDEQRRRYQAVVTAVQGRGLTARIEAIAPPPPPVRPRILLAQALLKGKKMDWLIQKATEIGVSAVFPVITDRTIARPDDERGEHRRERWQRIALEAAQQSGRLDRPEVAEPRPLPTLLAAQPAADLRLVLWERAVAPLKAALTTAADPAALLVLVGPEGGLASDEVERAQASGFIPASLGGAILRSETAALSVLSMLLYEFSAPRAPQPVDGTHAGR
jgi:16S rRNA (uracil1498-N3)-methyltransferase